MKTGLVLPGGGSKGAFQVGVIDYLAKNNICPMGIDFVSGVSVGALNALAVASYAASASQLELASIKLHKVWDFLGKDTDIWKLRWPPLLAALWNPSIGLNLPLKRILEEFVDTGEIRKSGVKVRVSAVDLLSGELHEFDETFWSLIPPVLASSSFPLAFPPEVIGSFIYTDGGVRDISPLKSAIDYGCDRVIVICNRDPYNTQRIGSDQVKNTFQVAMRCIDIMEHEILRNDIVHCQKVNQAIERGAANPRRRKIQLEVIYPSLALGAPLHFNKELISSRVKQGLADAKKFYSSRSVIDLANRCS